jgi:uncharacterized protein
MHCTIPTKIVVLYGPRQVGKTTLIEKLLTESQVTSLHINADEQKYVQAFTKADLRSMLDVIDNKQILFIDEAQNIPDIGLNLKILYDARKDLKIIISGSSSLDLAGQIKEPLTGRTRTYQLFPVSLKELRNIHSVFELKENLFDFLVYGMYPEVLTIQRKEEKIKHLDELASSYLYKDILKLNNIRYSDKLYKLLQLLALQVGSLVSVVKIANALDLSSETINNYIDLLEKSFVIFRRTGYSRNKAKEISKMDKIYFYDNGIRNALLQNFTPWDLRTDKGALWENFVINERMKNNVYDQKLIRSYFWRTYNGTEIDIVEEENGRLSAFELKANNKITGVPPSWLHDYPEASFQVINMENWMDFLL